MKEYSIYVHIPFCKSKCKYCDFNSYSNKDNVIEKYVEKIIYEINESRYFDKNDLCKTIYIGGGTPSYIDSKYISKILNKIYIKHNVDKNAEITIEVNPSSVTKEKLFEYKQSGINRISIGLQETNNNLLKLLGRIHTYENFLQKYELIKSSGIENINIDLMIGLPNQTLIDVQNTIDEIIKLSPHHISCYSLILYKQLQLYKDIKNNNYFMPDDNLERQMYYTVCDRLFINGYNQYEISNFAKNSFESKHNKMCWKQYEYIGFGAGAHSFVDNIRFSNIENLEKYIFGDLNNNNIIQEVLSKDDLMKEYMMLGSRLINGIDTLRFEQKYNENIFDVFSDEINSLVKKSLIEIVNEENNTNIKLTRKGIDFNNLVCEKFI